MFVGRTFLWRIMSASGSVVQRLEQRAQLADDIIMRLQQQVQQLRNTVVTREQQRLSAENQRLKDEVARLKTRLIDAEIRNGVKQVSVPGSAAVAASTAPRPAQSAAATSQEKASPAPAPATKQDGAKKQPQQEGKKDKKEKAKKGDKGGDKQGDGGAADAVDFRNLDLRIGKIVGVKKHPDADTLYVEEVELGEATPRTVVSGLVKHVPIEQMQDRLVILCCNLKPAKMRGILSQAMLMCASSPDRVEILAPPQGAAPGDRVSCEGYELGDFPSQMNPKRKIFERIQPDLKTNDQLEATYKGARWKVEGKGFIVASTMANSGIK